MRKQETEEQENRRKEELKQVRLRQQLDMYYKGTIICKDYNCCVQIVTKKVTHSTN